jgi:hypothetical protein
MAMDIRRTATVRDFGFFAMEMVVRWEMEVVLSIARRVKLDPWHITCHCFPQIGKR